MLRDFIKSLYSLCLRETSKNANINSFFPDLKVSWNLSAQDQFVN